MSYKDAVVRFVSGAIGLVTLIAAPASAQCPEEPPLRNFTGTATAVCPCFITGEEAAVILTAPAADYPIEITKIRITWASLFGSAPQSLESALKIYPAGLPNPGLAQFTLGGPVLTDGFINEFDISAIPGNKTIASGPFTVSLEFLNSNAGDPFAPSVVHDANGCTPGRNAVKTIPGGWADACALGVSGDWRIEVVYEKAAAAVPFNGSGANPSTLTSLTTPSLGQVWSIELDCTGHAPDIAAVLGYDMVRPVPALLSFGELLIDTKSTQVFKQLVPHGGGVASYDNMVPNDPFLCGLTMYTQGACFGSPGVQLSNALAVRAGG